MTNTQTIEVPDAVKAKMAAEAEAAEAASVKANTKREVSDEEWEAQMPKPSGYRLLIALPDVKEYYHDSTLFKTTDQMHKESIMSIMGIVIDMGADAYSDKDRFPKGPWCKEGDYVMFRMNTGTRFRVNGKEFRLMNDDSVEAVIPDPRGIMAV